MQTKIPAPVEPHPIIFILESLDNTGRYFEFSSGFHQCMQLNIFMNVFI